jgi:YesN/AraC family two-component response regulator
MPQNELIQALDKMKQDFFEKDWGTYEIEHEGVENQIHGWPGRADEDIMIVAYQYSARSHILHRHDYFYFNYCYKGVHEYSTEKNKIVVSENDIYAGQPFVSHRHLPEKDDDGVLVCIFIRPELVYRTLLPYINTSESMTNFLIQPSTDKYSEESIHFNLKNDYNIRKLIEIMIIEYANPSENTQSILRSLTSAMIMQIARKYSQQQDKPQSLSLSSQIIKYIGENDATVTLQEVATKFSYHPNYISSLLKKETGKSFSRILLEKRMAHALVLLQGTTLSIDSVSAMLGYSNPSNFHKAFREYYGKSPREYINDIKQL